MNRIRIFITDDHTLVLEGLAILIQSIAGFELVGKADTGKALIEALSASQSLPDVCLVDIEMPEMDGIETVKVLRNKFPGIKVIALTMHNESHFVSRMIAAGAHGYLLKNVNREIFISSIQRVLANEDFVLGGLMLQPIPDAAAKGLTQREIQVLKLISLGKSNKEIAADLFISDRTADTHRTNIKRKLKVSSLSELIQQTKMLGL